MNTDKIHLQTLDEFNEMIVEIEILSTRMRRKLPHLCAHLVSISDDIEFEKLQIVQEFGPFVEKRRSGYER